MSRYFTRPNRPAKSDSSPRADDDGWNPLLPPITVSDHRPVNTGLVDHRGDPILRAPNPVGFHVPRAKA